MNGARVQIEKANSNRINRAKLYALNGGCINV